MKGGTLEFDIVANNDGIKKALNETEKRIAGFSKATVEGGKSIDAMFDATNENIRIQKQVVKELESEYAKLEKEIKKVAPGKGRYPLQQQANAVKAEIEAEKNALTQLEGAVKKNEGAHVRLRTQLRNVVEQLAALEQAGQRGTDAYKKLQAEAGRLTDAMGDAQTQAKILAHDNAGLQGVISAVSGVAGAFSAAQGTISLFAGEHENLQKIMVKVQSLMAITIGLQQVANTLNKDSYFRIVTLTKAKDLFSAATFTAGKALVKFGVSAGVARVAATALMATLTLGLSVAITAVVIAFEKFRSKAAEAKKAQEDFNKSMIEAAVKPITAFKELQATYNALGNDMEKKQRFIYSNKTKFDELGVSVKTVKDAEDLLVRNSSKFIEACMLRAKAIATQELAVEKYKEVLQAQQKLEQTPKAYVSKKGTYTDGYGVKRKGVVMEKSSDWKDAEAAVTNAEAQYNKLINQQVEFSTKEKEILASLGADSATITEGSINALEDQINKLQAKYKEAGNDQERAKYLKQIQATQKTLDKITAGSKKTPGGSSTSKGSDPFLAQLEERKKKYTEYYKWVNSKDDIVRNAAKTEFAGLLKEGNSYLDYLKNQRAQIIATTDGAQQEIGKRMVEAFGNGNVDLLARPIIDAAELAKKGWEDAGEGIATVFSSQFGILDQAGKEVEILVTPILPDGTVLSPEELESYIYDDLQGAKDILAADSKGIVISVGVNQDGSAGEVLHQLQEQYYATDQLSKAQKDVLKKLNNAIANEANETELSAFEKELQTQLTGARSILEMLDIIDTKRKTLTGDGSELDNAKSSAIDKQAEEVAKQAEEQTQELLSKYAGYLGEKIALELELTNDLQLLETRRAKAATETDKKAIDDIIKKRKAQYNEDKANLLYAGYEATRGIIDLARDKALLSISNKAFMWESDRIKSELKTQKQAAEKTLEELQKIHREAPTEAIALEIEKVKLKIEELNAELKKMPKAKFQEMLSGFQKITSALGNLDGTVGEIFSNISREVDNLKVAFDETATKIDKVSAGIAAVVDIINMVSSASEERKRKEKEFYKAALAFAHEYTLTLNEQLRLQSALSDSVFITDYQAKINSGFEALAEATSQYEEAVAKLSEGKAKTGLRNAIDWGNVGIGAAAGAAAGAAIGSIVPVIGTAIGAVVGGAIGAIAGLFGAKKKKETFGGLLEVFPALVDSTGNLNKALAQSLINTNQLDDKTKILVQNALDWAEAVEAANEQIREVVADLAGDLGNNIRNSIVEAWKAGEDASKRMFEVAGESLEKFIEQLVYAAFFSDVFKDFEDELAASLDQITGDGDVVDDYDRLMDRLDEREGLYTAALEAIKQRAKERGFDLWSNKNDNTDPTTLSGAIKGASQESIDLLAGQTNAVRVNQIESIDLLREQLVALTGIYDRVGTSNRFLEAIERNTAASNSDPLRSQGITL